MRILLIIVTPPWFALSLFASLYATGSYSSDWATGTGLALGIAVGLVPALLAWESRQDAAHWLVPVLAKTVVGIILGLLACLLVLVVIGFTLFAVYGPV